MKPGAVLVDVAVDQGGCIETTHETTHNDPVYEEHGVVHYAVGNMPGAVPYTSTYALTNATLPYVLELALHGPAAATRADPSLRLRVQHDRRSRHQRRRGRVPRRGPGRPGRRPGLRLTALLTGEPLPVSMTTKAQTAVAATRRAGDRSGSIAPPGWDSWPAGVVYAIVAGIAVQAGVRVG